MKGIGHAATGILLAAPVLLHREALGPWGMPEVTDRALLAWATAFAVLPDIDLLLARITPLRHRGPLTHSLWSALAVGGGLLLLWAVLQGLAAPLEGGVPGGGAPGGGASGGGGKGVYLTWLAERPGAALLAAWVQPLTAGLAALGMTAHLLGDAMTKTGVPLWGRKPWHVPLIGGYAVYDNLLLNLVPVAAAGWVLYAYFGVGEAFGGSGLGTSGLGAWARLLGG